MSNSPYRIAVETLRKKFEASNTLALTRFAPSPTGFLHLGHIGSALVVWAIARSLQGQVLLRIEDHDATRFRPEFESAILQDLALFGLTADNLLPSGELPNQFIQRHRLERYETILQKLEANGAETFFCKCSRNQLKMHMRDLGLPEDQELFYSGTCRHLGLRASPNETQAKRLMLPPATVAFDDGICGPLRQRPQDQIGALLVKDRSGNWTYQYAVVADDLDQGINLVIRGQDLTESTGRQVLLRQMMVRALDVAAPMGPAYLHHPLLADPSGKKLSKRFLSQSARALVEGGLSTAAVLGLAAQGVGLQGTAEPTSLDQIVEVLCGRAVHG